VASAGWDRNGASGFDVGIAPSAYWLTQFEAVTRYLWLSVWPHPLIFEYGTFWVTGPAQVELYALVVVTLAVAVVVALWRRPALGFLGAWFFVTLAPTSIIPGRIQMIVEHRMYLPLAAVMTLAAIGIHAVGRRQSWMVFAALALGLGVLTSRRNEDYRSELSIWRDTVAKRPNNERAHYNLGLVWSQMPGRLNEAIAEFEEAVRLKPDFDAAHYNLGNALSQMPGRLDDAIAQYKEVLRLYPDSANACNNLGVAWTKVPGRLDEAIVQFEKALRLDPDLAEAHNNLGNALSQMPGRLTDAVAQYEEAVRLNPDYAEAHYNLANILAQMPGRLNDAIAEYKEMLRLKPDFAPGWKKLGECWFNLGGLSAAAAAFREEMRLSRGELSTTGAKDH